MVWRGSRNQANHFSVPIQGIPQRSQLRFRDQLGRPSESNMTASPVCSEACSHQNYTGPTSHTPAPDSGILTPPWMIWVAPHLPHSTCVFDWQTSGDLLACASPLRPSLRDGRWWINLEVGYSPAMSRPGLSSGKLRLFGCLAIRSDRKLLLRSFNSLNSKLSRHAWN